MKPSMQKALDALAHVQRCGAHARQTGKPCNNPVMANGTGRCRLHGGKSTGRPPKHGRLTKANLLQRDWIRLLLGVIALQEGIELKNFRPATMTAARAEEVLALILKRRAR